MEVGYYDNADFQSLLVDILNDDKSVSSNDGNANPRSISSLSSTSSDRSEALVSCNAPKKKYHYPLERKKRKIDVMGSDGSVVEFEYQLPLPRILKSDIRRSYATMYINVMNSGDFPLVFGFFDTFCTPTFTNVISRSFKINGEIKTFTVQRNGLLECIIYWYYNMYSVPDATMYLTDAVIVSDDCCSNSKVVANYTFHATKIYDTPVELLCNFKASEELRDVVRVEASESYKKLKGCGGGVDSMQEAVDRSEWMKRITDSVNTTFKNFKLKADPHPIYALGSFTMQLDDQNRITSMEIKSRGDPSLCNKKHQL